MPRRLLILTMSGRKGASSRYRVYQYVPQLQAAGFAVEIRPPIPKRRGLGRLIARTREHAHLLQRSQAADVIFIQKRLFSTGFIQRLRRLHKPVLFDFDDAIFTSPKGDWSAWTTARVKARLTAALGAASVVVAGNHYLADFARAHAPVVEMLPTAIDLSRYPALPPQPNTQGDGLTVGWIGGAGNHRYLDLLQAPLQALVSELPGFRLVVVSERDYSMPRVPVENRRWSEHTEVADLASFDIGVLPLAQDAWTLGKCALKALQYMAARVPAVCSAVGANREVIDHGVDGLLCESAADWRNAITQLAAAPDLRANMGERGRIKVERSYSMTTVGQRLIQLLTDLG